MDVFTPTRLSDSKQARRLRARAKRLVPLLVFLHGGIVWANCETGAYRDGEGVVAALVEKDWIPDPGLGYLLADGRFGSTLSDDKPFECEGNGITFSREDGSLRRLERLPLVRTSTTFASAGATLVGELIEPAGPVDASRPLVVMVQGSEKTPAIGNSRALLFAGMGISVFVYDKRGTGQSNGVYTQNFELLADDAAAAMSHVRELAAGRFGRAGYFGVSQGGWVAPLASTRSSADFIVVGFGLVASPIEEDLDQMLLEALQKGCGPEAVNEIRRLSEATARVVRSHFSDGIEELEALQRDLADAPWASYIDGEYSGDMLRMNSSDLRRIGRAVFDNLELIWDYDAKAALQKVDTPLLWILAEDDREAPVERTVSALSALKKAGAPVEAYLFPDTDHGMYEYTESPDGSRRATRVTKGYFHLISGWIHRDADYPKGRAIPLFEAKQNLRSES